MNTNKQFLLINNELDAQLYEIKRVIKINMNGLVADSMREKGLIYKQNFGVSLPALKIIAQQFPSSSDLANRLWLTGWRETYLLSILLYPPQHLTVEQAIILSQNAPTYEIQQALAQQLFTKINFSTQLCLQLAKKEHESCQSIAFLLAVRIGNLLTESNNNELLERGIILTENANFYLYNSISKYFGRLCRINNSYKQQLITLQTKWQKSSQKSKQFIAHEIKAEVDFLNEM